MDIQPAFFYIAFVGLGMITKSAVMLIMAGIIGIVVGLMLLGQSLTNLESLFSLAVIGSSVIVIGIGIAASLDR